MQISRRALGKGFKTRACLFDGQKASREDGMSKEGTSIRRCIWEPDQEHPVVIVKTGLLS